MPLINSLTATAYMHCLIPHLPRHHDCTQSTIHTLATANALSLHIMHRFRQVILPLPIPSLSVITMDPPNRNLEARAQNSHTSLVAIQHHNPTIPEHTPALPNTMAEVGHHPNSAQIKLYNKPSQIPFLPSQLPDLPSSEATMPTQPILSSPNDHLHGHTCPPTLHTRCSCCSNRNSLLSQAQSMLLSSFFRKHLPPRLTF